MNRLACVNAVFRCPAGQSDTPRMEMPVLPIEPVGLTRRVPLLPHQMTASITPTENLFMLAHLGVVRHHAPDWSFSIEGLVNQPLVLRLDELARFPAARLEAVHQCAGNPLQPSLPTRRISCVIWEGVWLRDVLAAAGVAAGANFLWGDGADQGEFAGEWVPFYRKDIPLSRIGGDVLLATHLNGAPLPDEHGGPLRLVVPGYFGTSSVKWLWRLTLTRSRATGIFTTRFYNDGDRPVWSLFPEAIFTTPSPGDVLAGPLNLRGWAWADAPVARVEISDDEGETWKQAAVQPRRQRGWQAWAGSWEPWHSGAHRLLCRATDIDGATQPMTGARNAVHAVDISVG